MKESKIDLQLYHSLTGSVTTSLVFKEQKQKVVENGFLNCHVIPYMAPNKEFSMEDNYLLSPYGLCLTFCGTLMWYND